MTEDDFDFTAPSGRNRKTYNLMDEAAMAEVEYLKAIERHLIACLAERYTKGEAVDIANLCDHKLDQSGRLLGRVRDKANGIKDWEPSALVGEAK